MIWLIFILYILYSLKCIWEQRKYNLHATIQKLPTLNKAELHNQLVEKQPIVIQNVECVKQLSHDILVRENPGYIVIDQGKHVLLSTLTDPKVETVNVYRNQKLCKDSGIQSCLEPMIQAFSDKMSWYTNYDLSAWKGPTVTTLSQSVHNNTLLYQIQGTSTIYLVNPKHTEEIQTTSIKKLSHKITLEPNQLLWIPPQWFYSQESSEPLLQACITSDTYFTWWYNTWR